MQRSVVQSIIHYSMQVESMKVILFCPFHTQSEQGAYFDHQYFFDKIRKKI